MSVILETAQTPATVAAQPSDAGLVDSLDARVAAYTREMHARNPDLEVSLECLVWRNNALKDVNAPIAIRFEAELDGTRACAAEWDRNMILELTRTHRVLMLTTGSATNIVPKLERIVNIFKKKVSLLLIVAHGDCNHMYFGNGWEDDIGYDDAFEIFTPAQKFLEPDARIFLRSCYTGDMSETDMPIARRIAEAIQRVVFAPSDANRASETWISPSRKGKPRLVAVAINEDYSENQYMYKFKPGKEPEHFTVSLELEACDYASAQEQIIKKNPQDAMLWFELAMEQGHMLSHDLVLDIFRRSLIPK